MHEPQPPSCESDDAALREHVVWLLEGGYAHPALEDVLDGLSERQVAAVPGGTAHSPWQIVEHLRICQRDLLDYTTTPGHTSPPFPEGLWPTEPGPRGGDSLAATLSAIETDRAAFVRLLRDESTELLKPIDHIAGRTVLRQALIAADHWAYHVGQLSIVRSRLRGAAEEKATGGE